MPVAQFGCNVNTLIQSAKCLLDNCMSDSDRSAIDILVRETLLAANGGTDYRNNLTKLLSDSNLWQKQSCTTLQAVSTWVDLLAANDNGAGLSTDPKTLIRSAKCLRVKCLGRDQVRGVKEFLKCSLYAINLPD